jgi:translocation and assembly module TamB
MKIVAKIAIGMAALVVILIVAAMIVVHTAWFQAYLKQKIIAVAEEDTGGRVEIGSLQIDWRPLRAIANNLTIHGTEPPGSPPFFHAARIELDVRLFTRMGHLLDLTYLGLDRPEANVIVFPDGRTNVPTPKTPSNTPALQTIVDLAVRHFELTNGQLSLNAQKQAIDVHGENLRAQLFFSAVKQDYEGRVSMEPLYAISGRRTPVRFALDLPVVLGRDRVAVQNASISTPASRITIDASVENMADPKISAHVAGRVALADVNTLGGLDLSTGPRQPSEIDLDADATVAQNAISISRLRVQFGQSSLEASGNLEGSSGSLDFGARLGLGELGRLAKLKTPPQGVATVSGRAKLESNAQVELNDVRLNARISIAPGEREIPLSGVLNVAYDASSDALAIRDSFLALPHTRATFSGALPNRIEFSLVSRDLDDLFITGATLDRGGQAEVAGTVTGSFSSPRIDAHAMANRLRVEGRRFDSLAFDAAASSAGISVSNGILNRDTMQARFTGALGLRNWKPSPNSPVSAEATMANADLADVLVFAGRPGADYSGALSAAAHVSGTFGNPMGAADIEAVNGTIRGEPFDRIQARVNLTDRLISIPDAFVQKGGARVDLTAQYQHPRDSFQTGVLTAHVQSSGLDLAQLRNLQQRWPNTSGQIQIQADGVVNVSFVNVSGNAFTPVNVTADVSARGLRVEGQNYGDLTANARTSQKTVQYMLTSDFAGSAIHVNGNTDLTRDYPTQADLSVANLPLERVGALQAAIQKKPPIPVKGNLSATAHFNGTTTNPQGTADVNLTNATIYDEPLDRVQARGAYLQRSIQISQGEIAAGPARVDLTGQYDHPAGDLKSGNLQFRLKGTGVELARIHNVQIRRPGLAGALRFDADGSAAVGPHVQIRDLTLDAAANGLSIQGKNLGDATLAARTNAGRLNFSLDSNLAQASIEGRGAMGLTGDYPLNADLTFKNVTWAHLQPLLQPGGPSGFDAATDGDATIEGPVMKTADLRGSLRLTRLTLSANPEIGNARRMIVLQNDGPIAIGLDRGTARIENLHLTGPQTDIQAHGTASIQARSLDLTVNANTNLSLIEQLDRDFVSAGTLALNATVRGTLPKPQVTGRMELHNASLNYVDFNNGISNANGTIQFNGSNATVQNITAESGGGRIVLSGFVAYGEGVHFGLRANAGNVRVRPQGGISAAMDANLELAGTLQGARLSGTVTMDRLTYEPQSDLGALLARSLPQVGIQPSPFLDKIKLDVQVHTTPATAIRSSLAQNLQVNADLRIRGAASEPGALGRITFTGGKLIFFGSTYTLDSGDISFSNPVRIDPVLNVNLKTEAQGVTVVVKVTGPVDNMKLSYTSDPPLQFQEIVELLAAGRTPTSDPNVLVNQPVQPQQSYAQMGESALVGQVLADPVTNRLQRVFGVTQLKVDPAFVSGSTLPQARLTLQQQVASNITFTYVTALDESNTNIVRVEWALNPEWSVIGYRNENATVSIRFAYKKQFR